MPMRATTVRFSEDLWRLLEREAEREGVSAAQFIRDASVMRAAYLMGRRGEPAYDALSHMGAGNGNGNGAEKKPAPAAPAAPLGAEEARRLAAEAERRRAELLEEAALREALLATAAAVQEPARVKALHSTGLLDSAPDPAFDRHVRLAAEVLNAPIALVSLIDEDRQFLKSCVGVEEPMASERETPLSHSFCQHAVAQREPLIVPDARDHPVLKHNPAVDGDELDRLRRRAADRRGRPRARHAVRARQPAPPVDEAPGGAARRPRGLGGQRDRPSRPNLGGMDHRPLGRTGVKVSPLCLGAMMFGAWGNSDHEESIRIIHRALDAGINFIDTADVYSRGESEEIVGKALKGRRDDIVLATKVHGTMGDDPNEFGNSRRWIVREVEASLQRLQTDYIDLYQIHRPEADTDIDETLGVLTDLVRQGKVRYIGSSTFPASQIVEAQWVARDRNRERFVCEQPPYSILAREIEKDVLPTCRRHGMAVIPWSPLAGGWLSGRWRKGQDAPDSTRAQRLPARYDLSDPGNQRKLEAADALARLAEESGLTLIQMALAFVINHPVVTAAIIGPRTLEQLESQLGAEEVALDAAILDRIDEIVPPGTTLAAADTGYQNPDLKPEARRR